MEKKSVYALCTSIIVGFVILGLFVFWGIKNNTPSQQSTQSTSKYQVVAVGNNVMMYDTETGNYWQKFIPSNEGPTSWTKSMSPAK